MPRNLLCWTDIPVTDLDRAIAFYSKVLAGPVARQSGPGFEFATLPHAGDFPSGCLSPYGDNRPSAVGPLIYLSVDGRLPEAVELARENGGTILAEIHPIGPYGLRALILDSEGNRIALHSVAE